MVGTEVVTAVMEVVTTVAIGRNVQIFALHILHIKFRAITSFILYSSSTPIIPLHQMAVPYVMNLLFPIAVIFVATNNSTKPKRLQVRCTNLSLAAVQIQPCPFKCFLLTGKPVTLNVLDDPFQ